MPRLAENRADNQLVARYGATYTERTSASFKREEVDPRKERRNGKPDVSRDAGTSTSRLGQGAGRDSQLNRNLGAPGGRPAAAVAGDRQQQLDLCCAAIVA